MDKIVFSDLEPWEIEYLKKSFPDKNLFLSEEKITLENVEKFKDANILSVFIYSPLTREILSKFPNLKYIATRSMGFDHIDLDYCREKEIVVSNVPTYGSHTVAEHAFALILGLSRKLIEANKRAKSGDFRAEGLAGFDLFGKTIGIIGTGNIGKTVAEIALGFGMKVAAFNRSVDEKLVLKGVSYMKLEELLTISDVITLHLPLNQDTQHIINISNINKIKKGAILINTARGGLVETQAILEALQNGILSGAGLDVLEEEGELREERELLTKEFLTKTDLKTAFMNHVLLTREDTIITPHNAFNSREALVQILETTVNNIKGFLMGQPQNLAKN